MNVSTLQRPSFDRSLVSLSFLCVVAFVLLIVTNYSSLEYMVKYWFGKEEYSHGIFLPVITVYILWQRRELLLRLDHTGSYFGALLVFASCIISLFGDFGTLYAAMQYGFILAIYGITLSVTGVSTFKYYLFPLSILFFMVPLPAFIYKSLSSELQLISSQLGVAVIELFNIPVYLEGNIIDLGKMKLQVVEACSGLRYLFPLSALAYILALIYQSNFVLKAVIFISSMPVTIFMNSLRIGLIGVTVDIWGIKAAEGLLHDLEGWVVFMASLTVLILEIRLLSWFMGDKRPLADLLTLHSMPIDKDLSLTSSNKAAFISKVSLKPLYISILFVLLFLIIQLTSGERNEITPDREAFSSYPQEVAAWSGARDYLNPDHLQALKLSDYLLMNFEEKTGYPVNYYVAYYDSQQKGRSAHSPKSCIPGDGWQMSDFERTEIVIQDDFRLPVNRTLISKGSQTSLVYYWFQQRGRLLNNEYLVKFYLLWDSITQRRSDGAMIRVTTPVFQHEGVEQADKRIQKLIRESQSLLQSYVPG